MGSAFTLPKLRAARWRPRTGARLCLFREGAGTALGGGRVALCRASQTPGVEVYNESTTTGDSTAINHSQASLNRAELQKCLWKLGIKRQKGCLLR